MKPVRQTTDKNCLSACIASILEIPCADVPTFYAESTWFSDMCRWLSEKGYLCLQCPACRGSLYTDSGYPFIVLGESPRGEYLHAVIRQNAMTTHDPHQSGHGIETVASVILIIPKTAAATLPFKPNPQNPAHPVRESP